MELLFGFKGENGKIEVKGAYKFDAETEKKLKEDFEKYLSGISSARGLIKGGCYPCTRVESNASIYLCVKFDEIVYIG